MILANIRFQAYLVSHSYLEHWSISLHPFSCLSRMFVPKLEEIAKDRYTGDFGEILDPWYICTIKIPYSEEEHGDDCYADALVAHIDRSMGYKGQEY